jgi:hypothetical protein
VSQKISATLADLSKRVAAMERQAVEDSQQTSHLAILIGLSKSACDELQRSYESEEDAAEAYGIGDLVRAVACLLLTIDSKAHRKWASEVLENWPDPNKKRGSK